VRTGIDGVDRWCAKWMGRVATRDGEWEYEPNPSSRTDDFIKDTRFATVEEAARAAMRAAAREEPTG
jgi:hypothetical protein